MKISSEPHGMASSVPANAFMIFQGYNILLLLYYFFICNKIFTHNNIQLNKFIDLFFYFSECLLVIFEIIIFHSI